MASRLWTVLGVGLLLNPGLAPPALAHTHLVRSEPAAQAALAAPPRRFALYFAQPIEGAFSRYLLIAGQDNRQWPLAADQPAVRHPVAVSGPLPELKPGRYVLRWSVVSLDGHRQEGRIPFTVR